MLGAMAGHDEVVTELVSLGARIDLLDKEDRSAVHHAAEAGYPTVMKFLLDRPNGRQLVRVGPKVNL